ncbi:MAG: hypothetical protein AB8H80_09460 [Planctomycetota bacterium]
MSFDQLCLLHLLATGYMTGLIWFVQVVHYPLFARVGEAGYRRYQDQHMARTTPVVLPPMMAELVLSGWLVAVAPPDAGMLAWTGAVLLAIVWASTFFVQVPRHAKLQSGFEEAAWRQLVQSNWLRTAAWSARAAIAVLLLW